MTPVIEAAGHDEQAMMPLVLPILAQTVAIGVTERTELRYVVQPDDRSFQGETRAGASVSLTGRNTGLSLSYSPALYVAPLTIPVDNVTILQEAGAAGFVGFQLKRSAFSLTQAVNYSQVNYALVALSAPAPGGSDPPPGAEPGPEPTPPGTPPDPSQVSASDRPTAETIQYLTATSSFSVSHQLSRRTTLGEYVTYTYHRALGDVTESVYPSSHGISTGASVAYQLSRRDETSSSLSGSYSWNTTGSRAVIVGLTQSYSRVLSRNSSAGVNGGIGYTRTMPATGASEDGLGAIVGANYTTLARVAKGILTIDLSAGYAPTIDASTTAISRRLGIAAGVSWFDRDRLTLFATSSATLSVDPDDTGAIQNVGVDLGLNYELGAGFSFATGARGAWTTFEQAEILPPTAVAYVALSWGASLLNTGITGGTPEQR